MNLTNPAFDTAKLALENGGAPKVGQPASAQKARETAEDFEAFFLAQVISTMFQGIGQDSLFGGGPGEDAFRGVLHQEYGKTIAKAGGVGVADSVMREILKTQEVGEP